MKRENAFIALTMVMVWLALLPTSAQAADKPSQTLPLWPDRAAIEQEEIQPENCKGSGFVKVKKY